MRLKSSRLWPCGAPHSHLTASVYFCTSRRLSPIGSQNTKAASPWYPGGNDSRAGLITSPSHASASAGVSRSRLPSSPATTRVWLSLLGRSSGQLSAARRNWRRLHTWLAVQIWLRATSSHPPANWCRAAATPCPAIASCFVLPIAIEQGTLHGPVRLAGVPCGVDRHRARSRIAGGLIRAIAVQPFQQRFERDMRLEVAVLQRVRSIDAAAIEARADQHQRLIEIGRQAAAVPARPLACKLQRFGAGE